MEVNQRVISQNILPSKPELYRKISLLSIHKQLKSSPGQLLVKAAILYFVLISENVLACYGGGGGGGGRGKGNKNYDWHSPSEQTPIDEYDKPDPPVNVSKIKNPVDRNLKTSWGSWTPPPETVKEWKEWLHQYQMMTNDTDHVNKHNRQKFKNEREPWDSGWPIPLRWQDLGEGSAGAPVPPWAFVPRYVGKPAICLVSPKRGNCKEEIMKWGYNPYTEQCTNYTWSGCGGSRNKFDTKEKCEIKCLRAAPADCVNDSGIAEDFQYTFDN